MMTKIQNLTFTALMATVICIAGPIVIPIGMVPMSFANMVIYLTILLLDRKKATISVAVYLLIGFVGLPVFSGFTGGAGKLFGPTGGYLIGYLALSFIAGSSIAAFEVSKRQNCILFDEGSKVKEKAESIGMLQQILALMAGTIGLYVTGTLWLMIQSKVDFMTALSIGVVPFAVFDILKIVAAVFLGKEIKKRIQF